MAGFNRPLFGRLMSPTEIIEIVAEGIVGAEAGRRPPPRGIGYDFNWGEAC